LSLTCKQLPLPDQALLFGNLISRLTDAAVFLIAEDGRILSWNPGVERILGYKEEQWVGQPFHMMFTPDDRALGAPQAEIRTALRDGQSPDIRWHLRRNGTGFFAEGSLVALRDESGQLLALSKVMRDVTRRKERELALKDALAYTEGVVNTVREPLLVLDPISVCSLQTDRSTRCLASPKKRSKISGSMTSPIESGICRSFISCSKRFCMNRTR
jgi:PAS domain S-box-containing protein